MSILKHAATPASHTPPQNVTLQRSVHMWSKNITRYRPYAANLMPASTYGLQAEDLDSCEAASNENAIALQRTAMNDTLAPRTLCFITVQLCGQAASRRRLGAEDRLIHTHDKQLPLDVGATQHGSAGAQVASPMNNPFKSCPPPQLWAAHKQY